MATPPDIDWSSPGDLELRYTGRLRADLDKLPRLATLIKQERSRHKQMVLLDTGGFSAGHVVSDQYRGRPVAEVMNHLDYDAAVPGKEEADWGVEVLAELQQHAGFPFLAANWEGFTAFSDLDRHGLPIRLVGLAWPEAPPGVTVLEPKAALERALEGALSEQIVLVLSQLGYEFDRGLALGSERIHVIFEGLPYEGFENVLAVRETLIVPACKGPGHLGSLRLELSGTVLEEDHE